MELCQLNANMVLGSKIIGKELDSFLDDLCCGCNKLFHSAAVAPLGSRDF